MIGHILSVIECLRSTKHQRPQRFTKDISKGNSGAYNPFKWLINAYRQRIKRRTISVKNNDLR